MCVRASLLELRLWVRTIVGGGGGGNARPAASDSDSAGNNWWRKQDLRFHLRSDEVKSRFLSYFGQTSRGVGGDGQQSSARQSSFVFIAMSHQWIDGGHDLCHHFSLLSDEIDVVRRFSNRLRDKDFVGQLARFR